MSDFGQFSIQYKRSASADLVTDQFRDIFDVTQFISNNMRCFDVQLDPLQVFSIPVPAAPQTVLFAMFILRDVYPVQTAVFWTTQGGAVGTALVRGLDNSNLPKPESQTGSFCVLPQIQNAGAPPPDITLVNGDLEVTDATFYLVTT